MANADYITSEKDFTIPEGWSEVQMEERSGGAAPLSTPVDRFASGAVSTMTLGLQTDIAASQMGGNVPVFRIQPPQPSGIAAANSAAQSVIKQTQVVEGPGVLFETNGIKDPNQTVQNLEQGSNITITVDAAGNKTISAASSNTPEWPLPNTALAYMARAIVGQTALQVIGDSGANTSSAGSGTVSAGTSATATDGVNVQISTGATTNSAFGWNSPGTNSIFWYGRSLQFQARGRFPNTSLVNSGNVYLGFSTQTASNLRPPGVSGSIVAISTNFGTLIGTIFNGAAQSSVNLSFTMDANTHSYGIIMDDVNNITTFYIDGNAVGSLSGVNPSGVGCWPTISILNRTVSGITSEFNVEYFYAQQAF